MKLYATLLSISKMAGPLSAAATAHWVPLAFRSHSNSQQTDLASMADHVQRTTQLVNFFFLSNSSFFERGQLLYLSKCFVESARALIPPLNPPHHACTQLFWGDFCICQSYTVRWRKESCICIYPG